jgi:hypothetical protein
MGLFSISFFDYAPNPETTLLLGIWTSFSATEETHAVLCPLILPIKGKGRLKAPAERTLLNQMELLYKSGM